MGGAWRDGQPLATPAPVALSAPAALLPRDRWQDLGVGFGVGLVAGAGLALVYLVQ
jgi:hypothetical protein